MILDYGFSLRPTPFTKIWVPPAYDAHGTPVASSEAKLVVLDT